MQLHLRAEPISLRNPARALELGEALRDGTGLHPPGWVFLANAYAELDRLQEAIVAAETAAENYAPEHPDRPGVLEYVEKLRTVLAKSR